MALHNSGVTVAIMLYPISLTVVYAYYLPPGASIGGAIIPVPGGG